MLNLADIQELFESAESMPSKPDYTEFPIYVITDVIDEDKSVKWNREEIKKRMAARKAETKRLHDVKLAAIHDAHSQALEYIQQETGVTIEKATILWDFIISNYAAYKIDLWTSLQDHIDFYNQMK